MTSVENLSKIVDIVIGVDTHVNTHAAAFIDARTGGVLAELTIDATAQGYQELVEFADQVATDHAALRAWAIEGTGSHGRGLSVHLNHLDELVIELDRPERAKRRGGVKSDPADAIRAAREALARPLNGTPRGSGDNTEHAAIRQALTVRLAVRRSAVQAAGNARRQLFSAVLTAPEPIRERFRGLTTKQLITKAAGLRTHAPWANTDIETSTTVTVIQTLAKRIQTLTSEAADHERHIKTLVRSWRPDLLNEYGIGPIVAATILCAWSHPDRIHSEAAFAKLAGVSPIEATSGQVHTRHRLNPYGDRRLNCAIHTIAITRQRSHPATQTYTKRRTTEGKTPREIRRCLKRYIARDIYRLLQRQQPKTALDET